MVGTKPGIAGVALRRNRQGIDMDIEDLEPQHQKPKPKNLDDMSIEALGEYIADLESEIARVRQAIAAKRAAQNDADSVFKK